MAVEVDRVQIEAFLLLRNAVIERAMDDYKSLAIGACKEKPDRNIREIEVFLLSRWCGQLLNLSAATGPEILAELHGWHDEYSRTKKAHIARKITRHK